MVRIFALSALAGVVSAGTYKVEFTASSAKDTSSAVSVSLGSNMGTTPFVPLGRAFTQGVTKSEFLQLNEINNLPSSLKLKARDWNGLNFVTVSNGGPNVAQFKTDYFESSGAPHSASGTYFYDQVYSAASGATVLSAPKAYKISWETGFHANAGSKSPMYVQLQGAKGHSRYYLVDDIFSPGHAGERNLGVWEDIGDLQSIELLAGGPDSWNPVNFIEVLTPTAENVQFKANVMLDQLPTDPNAPLAYGIYPHSAKAQLTAVNVEGTAGAARTYQVSYQTGTHQNSASSSPHFMQLVGDSGASNFVKLGDDFQKGKRNVIDVSVAHSFGLLKAIKLQAGGTDGWNVVGDLSVRTPQQVEVHFQTDLFLDEKPHDAQAMYGHYTYYQNKEIVAAHPEPPTPCQTRGQLNCCGNGICDATEDVGNCGRDCIHSGHDSYAWGMVETAPPTTKAPHDPFNGHVAADHDWTKKGKYTTEYTKAQNAAQTLAREVGKVKAMAQVATEVGYSQKDGADHTSAKKVQQHVTTKGKSCTVGAKTVKDGWTMEGTGSNYCNWCKCNEGAISCTRHTCGMPFGGNIPTGWSKCAKVACKFDANGLVRVKAHHLEGGEHSCAYNKFTKDCSCYCKPKKTDYNTREVGKYQFATGGFVGKHCEAVKFSKDFDAAKGGVRTVVTVSHTMRTKPVHDAPMLWVEESTMQGFTVCAREDKKFWNTYDKHDHRLVVDYYSYQAGPRNTHENAALIKGPVAPFAGARGGATAIPSRSAGGVHCKTIPFGTTFDKAPIVVGSIDHQNFHDSHQATSHWIEDINGEQFRVCFRESAHNDDGHDEFFFNWMAVQHQNPSTWYGNHGAYSAAGSASSNGLWAKPKGVTRANAGLLACKWIDFQGVTFSATPTVLLDARHASTGAVDWSATPIHPSTLTYVNKVTDLGFEACSTTMFVEGVSSKDEALEWNYIAFGDHVADTKVVTIQDAAPNSAAIAAAAQRTLSTGNGSPAGARNVDGAVKAPNSALGRFNWLMKQADPTLQTTNGGATDQVSL